MQHKSLSTEIASKDRKSIQSCEPTFFSEIPYSNVQEINYLRDLEEKKKHIDFPIFQFQKDFGDEAQVNEYDKLANTLYKKIMQQGYIQEKKAPSKKKKKTKNPFEYDYEDTFINDEEAHTVKKNIYVKMENFKCLNSGIEQFYNSELYRANISQIQQQSKKRSNEITMDAQELEEIKKKIKENISITHNQFRIKEEPQEEQNPTPLHQDHIENEENQNTMKDQHFQECQNRSIQPSVHKIQPSVHKDQEQLHNIENIQQKQPELPQSNILPQDQLQAQTQPKKAKAPRKKPIEKPNKPKSVKKNSKCEKKQQAEDQSHEKRVQSGSQGKKPQQSPPMNQNGANSPTESKAQNKVQSDQPGEANITDQLLDGHVPSTLGQQNKE